MATKIQLKRGAASTWAADNDVLSAGELGYETDTRRMKVGDGIAGWNSLPYVSVREEDIAPLVAVAVADAPTVTAAASAAATTAVAEVVSGTNLAKTVITGKNLYNPADLGVVNGVLLLLDASGGYSASASYTTSGFIPVVGGQQYAINRCRRYVLYTPEKAYASQTDNPASPFTTVTPAATGFLRISFDTTNQGPTMQVELGAVATSYMPYEISVVGLDALRVANAAASLATTAVTTAVKGTFGKNKYNPADPDVLVGYTLSSGTAVVSAAYTMTGYIRVAAGTTITFSHPRQICFYADDKAPGTVNTVDNASGNTLTIVVPAGMTLVRASFNTVTWGATFQVEAGGAATAYEAYTVAVSGLSTPPLPATSSPVALTRTGDAISMTSKVGAASLVVAATLKRPDTNLAFNLVSASLDGVVVTANTDDVTPIRTQLGTLGANHGFSCVSSFANPDVKTAADLGSVWTDGAREYVLLGLDATNRLMIGGAYTDAAGVTSSASATPTVNLTHVSGAVHQAPIDFTTCLASQLYPATGRVQVALFADGVPVTADGTVGAREVTVRESYEIYSYASLYDLAKANVGVSYTTLPVTGEVRITNTFVFSGAGRCRISSTLTALRSMTLGVSGFIQSICPTKAGAVTWRYLPGVSVIGGFDFAAGVDMTAYATSLIVASTDLLAAGVPPCFVMDRFVAAGVSVGGFAMGYPPYAAGIGSNAARIIEAPANLWDLRSSKKSYPTANYSSPMVAGNRVTVESFRVYLSPAQIDAVRVHKDALTAWSTLEAVAGLSD